MTVIHIAPSELAGAPSWGSPTHRYIHLGQLWPWHIGDLPPEVVPPEGWQVCRIFTDPPLTGVTTKWYAEIAPADQPSVVERLTAATMYLLEIGRVDMDKTKVHHLLYIADRTAFRKDGYSITGATYLRFPNGPVPLEWDRAYYQICKSAMVILPPDADSSNRYWLRHQWAYPMGALNAPGMTTLARTEQGYRTKDTEEMIWMAQREPAWLVRQDGAVMPLTDDIHEIVGAEMSPATCERHA